MPRQPCPRFPVLDTRHRGTVGETIPATVDGNRKPRNRNKQPKHATPAQNGRKLQPRGPGNPGPRVVFVSLLTTPAGVVLAWEPRVYNASTVHRVPCFAPAPLCVGFYGFELFATVPRGLPPQPVKVPGTTTRPGCPVHVVTTMCKCSRVFLSVARLPGIYRRALYTMDYQQPPRGNYGPGVMWAPCTGAPATTDFFWGFPGCSPRHRAGNNPAKPRQHKRIVHRLYNPPRPRFRSRLRPSHLAQVPAVAYNQPGPGCSRIHPAKCVFQCGFAVGMVHLRANMRDYLPTARRPYTATRSPLPRPPTGDTQQFLQVVPQPRPRFSGGGVWFSVLSRCLPVPVARGDNNRTGRGTIPGVALVLCCAHIIERFKRVVNVQ